ncbi:cache domain-containing sensor histidine kinase [Lachnoclostridium phocaeense]|uniref:cache domain-containing sensor histidine kinase n=1 Tax=Lachnoclostridium phocaeense TaxID=1871021 RepID=UPI00248E705B|nr:sensor histidine kinase [Lachnoclostridium phocaeense]
MEKKRPVGSLFFQIICTVILGTASLVIILSMINIRHSEEVFVKSFSESQEKIFDQIDQDFYNFYEDIAQITGVISQSQAFWDYMTDSFEDQIQEREDILAMQSLVEGTEFDEYAGLNLFVIGENKKTYIYNSSDKIFRDRQEILDSDIYRKAVENPTRLVSDYQEEGFTEITSQAPVVLFAKALNLEDDENPAGVIMVTIMESDFRDMYSHFTSRTSDMLIFNRDGELLSSNRRTWFREESQEEIRRVTAQMEEEGLSRMEGRRDGRLVQYQRHKFRNTDYEILGIIRPEDAFSERYNMGTIVIVTVLITLAVGLCIFFLIRRQTRPLYALAQTMQKAGEGDLDAHAEVTGTGEVRLLSSTYNQMMEELKQYIEQVRSIEKEKRTAEIHALQMQINPHYMYNTLASIKWLALQGNVRRTTEVIDAFISLLRNTISNTKEFITVEEEIENLKNYVLITQTRYGEHVSVEYYVTARCLACKVPKLILQPFVENSFFHGFPEGRRGKIEISAKIQGQYLRFDIEDDGVGMTTEKLMDIRGKNGQKTEHFTGIGVNNVDNRIKMIYGMDYGINIVSQENEGTKITILLPLRE